MVSGKMFKYLSSLAVVLTMVGSVQAQYSDCASGNCGGATSSYFAQPASASSGPYVSVFAGYSALQNVNATGFQRDVDADFDDGISVGAAIGRRINGGPFRVEGEFAYRNNQADEINFNGNPVPAVAGDISSFAFMLNLYRDFETNGRIKPYIGAGAGFAFVDADFQYGGLPAEVNGQDSTFAYQAMAGLTAPVNNRVDWYVEYRFFAADQPKLNRFGGPPINGAPQDIILDSEYFTHGIQAGIRIKSW